MADGFIQLNTDGTGKKLDTRTEGTNSEHRQVFVLGDPATNAGVASVDATKGLAVDLTNTGANATAIKVDNSAVTQPVSGTVTASDGTNNISVTTAGADGTSNTFNGLRTSAHLKVFNGTTWDRLAGDTTGISVKSHAVTNSGTFAVQAAQTGTWNVGSSSATGSAVPANAFYQGLNPQTALPAAATAGNLTGAMADKFGRQVVLIDGIRDISATQTTTITASTAETTIGTAVASTFLDLTSVLISNTSATATRVDFRDTTAGSVIFSIYVPAGDTRGFVVHTPIPQTTVNTNWTAQSSASVTDLRIFIKFIKNK